jgi:hypothetical protein
MIVRSRRLLCRRQASEYLATQHGLDISPEQLSRWAVKGGGPPFHLLAGRIGKAVYCTLDLDKWATGYVGPRVGRIAEHPAYQQWHAAA